MDDFVKQNDKILDGRWLFLTSQEERSAAVEIKKVKTQISMIEHIKRSNSKESSKLLSWSVSPLKESNQNMDLRKRAPSMMTHNTFQPLKTVNKAKRSKVTFNITDHNKHDSLTYDKELCDLRHKKRSLEQKQFNSSPSQSSNNN